MNNNNYGGSGWVGFTAVIVGAFILTAIFIIEHVVRVHVEWGLRSATLWIDGLGLAGLLVGIALGGEPGAYIGAGAVIGWLIALTAVDVICRQQAGKDAPERTLEEVTPKWW